MKAIEIKNQQLLGILDSFLKELLTWDRSRYEYRDKQKFDPTFTPEYACGNEYLAIMQSKKVDGYPERVLGFDLTQHRSPQDTVKKTINKLDNELISWSGSRNCAVKMLYPKGGYMGWHHNANAPGYNILLSWSKEGTGYFRYQDPITKEIITMNDTPGWTCKVGYYGKFEETDKVYWHCANAEHEERLTLGYIIPHEGLWADMVDDIQL